jgi:putative SOS response-associated peptidase YedK
MCYNYSNYVRTEGGLVNKYKLRISERQVAMKEFADKYHFYYTTGFSHSELPVVTMQNPEEVQFFNWGLIPSWVKDMAQAKDIRKITLNATCEGVFEKPSFRGSIRTKRCLVPATGFFEWHHEGKDKYPYHVTVRNYDSDTARPFYFGGLYNTWTDKQTGEVLNTFTIITTPANEKMEFIHNNKKRMPLIMHSDLEEMWLNPNVTDNELKELMVPFPTEHIKGVSISKLITGKSNRNVPELLYPEKYEAVPEAV